MTQVCKAIRRLLLTGDMAYHLHLALHGLENGAHPHLRRFKGTLLHHHIIHLRSILYPDAHRPFQTVLSLPKGPYAIFARERMSESGILTWGITLQDHNGLKHAFALVFPAVMLRGEI